MSVLSVFRKRPRLNVIAFTITLLAAVAAMEMADLWWRHDNALAQAESRARNLSIALGEYVHATFAAADAALRQLAVDADRVGGPSAPHQAWDPILAAARSALPGVGSFTITDRDGIITHSNVPALVGASRRDDYLFRRLASSTRDELVIDRPFLSVTSPKQYIIPLGRRLVDARGRFAGVAVATLRPEAYRSFFTTLDLGEGGLITVLHPDGVVLFREPSASNPINEAADDSVLYQRARQAPNGVVYGPLQRGGPQFITTYRTIASPPLIISVSLRRSDVLSEWYRQRRVALAAYGALALTMSGMVLLLFRVIGARERAERDLAEVQRQEAERLTLANQRLADALDREQAARRQVEEASYMKDEFLMTVSHELRTPMTAIYGWVRVLTSREMPRPEQVKALGIIERNALAQTRLIDDLLDVSRAISGKIRLESRPVDVAAVVRAAAETLGPALTAKRLQLTLDLPDGLDPIPADPDRLQQIVWNLLSNAIKFTPQDGRIAVHAASSEDGGIEITVRDSGAGIPADFLPYVFDRFRQADAGTRRHYGGLGLGLAIVRHLVELHGGTVSVWSEGEGKGAIFRVRLPAHRGAAAPPAAPVRTPAPAAPVRASALDGVHVLIVDDEADSRELFGQILERAGARVTTAQSAAEALTRLLAEPIDVLMSDIEMPSMDGYELIRLVRGDSRLEATRIRAVAVTAYARAADRRRALDAGYDEHLAKPVDPAALVGAIASLCGER